MRRSRSVESGGECERTDPDDTNTLMREYLLQLAEERRERMEREAQDERMRIEEAARLEKEKKRLERLREKQQYEEDRDARLLIMIDAKIQRDQEERRNRGEVVGKQGKKVNELGEPTEEEKERLRRTLALHESFQADEELLLVRKQAAGLRIHERIEKRKRGKEVAVENSPPMITPEKRSNMALSDESRRRIEELRSAPPGEPQTSSTPRRIDLTLKHISASCGPGGKERYEAEVREFYGAPTVEELKEVCKREKVNYDKREIAIKRLVIQRVAMAYDAVYIPLPATPKMTTRSAKAASENVKAEDTSEDSSETEEDEGGGGDKRRRTLYNWLGKVGAQKYVAIPIYFSSERCELEVVESTLIKLWSPSLNTRYTGRKKTSKKGNRRSGKRERRRNRGGDDEERVKKKEGRKEHEIGRILEIHRVGEEKGSMGIVHLLREVREKQPKEEVKLESNGGNVWADGWRLV
ncbi:hypothetical protein CBR_g48369 [Chara braunii]|uniref:Uncharacterized protein n=1 Tax=Chara braunii TaxID=69332 RepID=A0A388K4M9_CHABU|nr:hypothetical protein CBR_g48369 [Chara braunii]|eukprot:GBG64903.1 hypothetical protein CBR_g48369 [Chara braunii]